MKPFDAAIILAVSVALIVTAICLWREPLAPILGLLGSYGGGLVIGRVTTYGLIR
jgi:uncharacterized membrane protein